MNRERTTMSAALERITPHKQLHRSGNSRLRRLLPPGDGRRSADSNRYGGEP